MMQLAGVVVTVRCVKFPLFRAGSVALDERDFKWLLALKQG